MSTDTLDKDAEIKRLREELEETNAKLKARDKAMVRLLSLLHEQQEKQKAGPTPDNLLLACRVAKERSDSNASPPLQADTVLAGLMRQLGIAKLMHREERATKERA